MRPVHVGDERGSATLELVVWAPGLLLVIGMLVVAGRVNAAHATVEQAAVEAARAASIARAAGTASARADAAATQSLAAQSLQCRSVGVRTDLSGFAAPPGQAAAVTATVSCDVRLSDLAVLGLPGTRTVTRTATSGLDTFRERS